MGYQDVIAAINQGNLQHIYLVSGEENYLADKIEQALLKKLLPDGSTDGLQVYSGDVTIDALINSANAIPFFADNNIIIVRNPPFLKERKLPAAEQDSAAGSKQAAKLEQLLANIPAYSFILLRTNEKIDKRRKLYKLFAKYGCTVEAVPIRAWEVKDWLPIKLREIERSFERDAYNYFIEITSVMNTISLGFLDQEINKAALYSNKKIITKADLQQVMASLPEVSVFAMLDAISVHDTGKALQLLLEQLAAGIHPLRLITMLSRHVRQLWQAKLTTQSGGTAKTLAAALGIVPFIAEKLLKKSQSFSEDDLKKAQLALADADYQFKSGQADAALLERIIINLCR